MMCIPCATSPPAMPAHLCASVRAHACACVLCDCLHACELIRTGSCLLKWRQIVDVPRLSLEERLRICWSYVLEIQSDIPTKTFESLCASKSDSAYPRYLKVAMRFLSACQVGVVAKHLLLPQPARQLLTLHGSYCIPGTPDSLV